MQASFVSETELPGRSVSADTLRIIAHRYRWASEFIFEKEVLEVGCGPGLGLGWLSQRAKQMVAGDVTKENLTLANKHYGSRIDLAHMDAHTLPFKDNSFDAVVCLATVIYLDLPIFFDECHRVLRTGGVLIINTPNKDRPSFRPSRLSRKYYSVPELDSLLNRHRFDPKFFGAFITPQSSAKICSKIFSFGRRVAGRTLSFLGLYEPIKRFIGFRTAGTALSKELREEEMKLVKNVQVVPLRRDSPDLRHRIIYTIARAE